MTSVATVAAQLKLTVLLALSRIPPWTCSMQYTGKFTWQQLRMNSAGGENAICDCKNQPQWCSIKRDQQEGLGSFLSWLDLCHHSQQRKVLCVGQLSIGALLVHNLILSSIFPHWHHSFKSISLFLLCYFQLSGFKNALQVFNWTLWTAKEFEILPQLKLNRHNSLLAIICP